MIYVDNDFYSNFNSVAKANDDVTMKSILVDQISNVISKRKDELIDLFGKVGIKVSANPSNKELVNSIVANIGTNKKLVIGISYLIAKDNDILQSEVKKNRPDKSNAEGDDKSTDKDPKKKKPVDWSKSADAVSTIANSISVFADTLTMTKKGQFEDDLSKQTDLKNPDGAKSQDDSDKGKTKGKGKTILFVVLGLAVVGGIIYAYKKGVFTKKPEIN